MAIELWGGFALVPNGSTEVVHQQPGISDCGCDDDHDLGPWEQPRTEVLGLAQLRAPHQSYADTKLPEAPVGGLELRAIHVRRSSVNDALVQVDLAYGSTGEVLGEWYDATLRIFWSALAPTPLGRTLHGAPLDLFAGDQVTGRMNPLSKILVRNEKGLASVFTPEPPATLEGVRIPNSISWFEGAIYWSVQGYLAMDVLMEITESLRGIGSAVHPAT